MRPLPAALAAFVLLPAAHLAATPAEAFGATTCSGTGPIMETRVAAGSTVTIFGSYTDWADPGSVVATFRGPGGKTRTAESANGPDGTYTIDQRFGAADLGTWRVSIAFSETAGGVTCDDAFTVAAAVAPTPSHPVPLPPTDADAPVPSGPDLPNGLLALAAVAASGVLVGVSRRSAGRARR